MNQASIPLDHLPVDRIDGGRLHLNLHGAVFVRAAYEGESVTEQFLSYTIDRVIG